jgi:hypothetical protein
MRPSRDLRARLAPFFDAGMLSALPTTWQIRQGELSMWAWVISTDVTDERAYDGAVLGHPLVRQLLIFPRVGYDHLRVGTGLPAKLESVCRHLHFTYHQGMPVWDLQLVHTHPGGFAHLRRRTEELLADEQPWAQSENRMLRWILPDAPAYHRQFLGPDGWIARAEAFDYPSAESMGSPMPERYTSLVSFLQWTRTALPAHVGDLPARRLPGHLVGLATERFRERGGFGWATA